MLRSTPFRPLVAVYTLAILAAICEFLRGPAALHEEPDIYGDPNRNFPEAMARLYPGRPETEYLLGRRLESVVQQNIDRDELQRNPELRRRFLAELDAALQDAARHYARALSLGLKSEENLQYGYALTLIRIQADPREIDRVISAWRRNFPFSDRRDLELRRRTIERQLRQVSPTDAPPAGKHDPLRKRDGPHDRAALETGGVDQQPPSRTTEHLAG